MKLKFLKPGIIIPAIITVLILSSCSKDSDPTPADNLIGTWSTQSSAFTAMINGKTMTQYLIDDMGLTTEEAQQYIALFNTMLEPNFTGTITLKSNNTYTSTMGGETSSGTWSLSSDGKKLTTDAGTEGSTTLDVIELTSSTLHVTGTETATYDINGDDTPETIIVTVDLTFKKQ
jgi:hypothetical protein